ncbi:MarR family transcriptional regulator [Marinobacter sp. CHS3-4]|uniref:MarR family winged helix-turn-helix transcriptional regulator n=1 Tax=Marinobacter sp. CHS3-4 TaxID=3045174 RepID=UPI0024B5E90D|nr:MarR family transcriptional regulator [Marinobacter sp. CHS3-4]MDI9246434.1 MarR family transcriptional regulator [Marinobacter sp. CHS3-4]
MDRIDDILNQWRQERPNLDVSAMGTIGRIKVLNQLLVQRMERTWAEFGLNGASFDVLATLRRSGAPYALSPGELMSSTMVTSGTMTHRVDLLVKAGLVERIRNPQDGRGFLISLSRKGLDVIEEAVDAHVQTQTQLTSALDDAECDQLDELLRKLLAGLESR